jgi:hypothetical protein
MSGLISVEHKGVKLSWRVDDDRLADKIVALLVNHLTGQTKGTGWDKPRNQITDELLLTAAEVYLAAPESGRYRAVREHFNVTQSAAGCYIKRARDLGLIPPSTHHASRSAREARKAGEPK